MKAVKGKVPDHRVIIVYYAGVLGSGLSFTKKRLFYLKPYYF